MVLVSMLFDLGIITSLSTMQLALYILLLYIIMYNPVGIIDTYIYTYKCLIINTNCFTNQLSSLLLNLPEILSSLLPALYIILLNTFPCLKYNIYMSDISLDITMWQWMYLCGKHVIKYNLFELYSIHKINVLTQINNLYHSTLSLQLLYTFIPPKHCISKSCLSLSNECKLIHMLVYSDTFLI